MRGKERDVNVDHPHQQPLPHSLLDLDLLEATLFAGAIEEELKDSSPGEECAGGFYQLTVYDALSTLPEP